MLGTYLLLLLILPAYSWNDLKLHKLKQEAVPHKKTVPQKELAELVAQRHEERARLIRSGRQTGNRLKIYDLENSHSDNPRRQLFARAAFNKAMGRGEHAKAAAERKEARRERRKDRREKREKRKEKKKRSSDRVYPKGKNLNLNLNMKLNMKIPTSALKYAGKYRFQKRGERGVSDSSESDTEDSVGDETDIGFAPHLESMTLTEGYGDDYHVVADLMNDSSEDEYDEVAVGYSSSDSSEDFDMSDSNEDEDELEVSSIPDSLGEMDSEDLTDLISYFFGEHEDEVGVDEYDSSDSDDTMYVSDDPEDIENEIALGDSSDENYPELLEEEPPEMGYEFGEEAVGEDEIGSWPEALLWEEHHGGEQNMIFGDDLSDLLNAIDLDDDEIEVGEDNYVEQEGLLGLYDSTEFVRRRRLRFDSDSFEDLDAFSSFYAGEDPVGDSEDSAPTPKHPFLGPLLNNEMRLGEESIGEERIIDALTDYLTKNDPPEWDVDDQEDEELVGDSSEDELTLEDLPDLQQFLDSLSDSEEEVGDEPSEELLDMLENYLRQHHVDLSSEETVGENKIDWDAIDRMLGASSSEETSSSDSSDPYQSFVNELTSDSGETAVGDVYDSEEDEIPVAAEMTEDDIEELLERYLSNHAGEEAVGGESWESEMMLRDIQDYLLAHDGLTFESETAVGDEELPVGDFYDPLFGFEDDLELEPFERFASDDEEIAVGDSYDLSDSSDFDSSEELVSSEYDSDDIDLDREEQEAEQDLRDSDEALSESDSYDDDSEVDTSSSWEDDSEDDSLDSDEFDDDFSESEDSIKHKKEKKSKSHSSSDDLSLDSSAKESSEVASASSSKDLDDSMELSDHEDSGESEPKLSSKKKKSTAKGSSDDEIASASKDSDEVDSEDLSGELSDEPLEKSKKRAKDDAVAATKNSIESSSSSEDQMDDSHPKFDDGYKGLDSIDGDAPVTMF